MVVVEKRRFDGFCTCINIQFKADRLQMIVVVI